VLIVTLPSGDKVTKTLVVLISALALPIHRAILEDSLTASFGDFPTTQSDHAEITLLERIGHRRFELPPILMTY